MQNLPPFLITPVTIKESTSTAAPMANVSNLIGFWQLPEKLLMAALISSMTMLLTIS